MDRETITAVVLTKNVEDIIGRCLKSISWVDEIVVVDGCGTDRTVEIARRHNARVISHRFNDSFAEDRNLGIEHATKDWVIQMDADEVMTDGLAMAIQEMLGRRQKEYIGYKFRRKNYFLGHPMRYGGWYSYMPMLFRRGCATFKGRVHETLEFNGKMGVIDEDLDHHPFQSLSQFMDRQIKYTTLQARQLFEEKRDVSEKEIRYNLSRRPLKLFWKFYIKKAGFREGFYGFIFSVLYAWVHFMKWAKYWEIKRRHELRSGPSTSSGPSRAKSRDEAT